LTPTVVLPVGIQQQNPAMPTKVVWLYFPYRLHKSNEIKCTYIRTVCKALNTGDMSNAAAAFIACKSTWVLLFDANIKHSI